VKSKKEEKILRLVDVEPNTFTFRMRDVRVCLVGDEGVGKSTIISSLIK